MYHNVVLIGNISFSGYFEYKNGFLIEFDIESVSKLLLAGDEIHIRKATDDESLEIINALKGK